MKYNIKTLFLLSLLLLFTKQEPKPLKFNGTTLTESVENESNMITFKISVLNVTNYLKITAKGKGSGDQSQTNHIISYHKNEKNINEREQLSQGETGITFMYLNKKQIENDFFISVQCKQIPCNYDFILETSEYVELGIDDVFSYYVTESNKQMKFKISGIPYTPFTDKISENNTITIYAIGSLQINSILENAVEYTKHKNYNAYLIQIYDLNKKYEFFLTINGTPGDLINIGSHFHDGTKNSLSNTIIRENGHFIYGYLNKNIKSKNCFKTEYSSGIYENIRISVIGLDKPWSVSYDLDNTTHSICAKFNNINDGEVFYLLKISNKKIQILIL